MKGFFEAINEAKKEAFKRLIEANAVFINKGFAATNEIVFSLFNNVQIVKPMILGLKAEITDELPEEFAFAVAEVDSEKLRTEEEKQVRKETAREIYNFICESGIICVAPDTIKMYFKENYDVEVDE